VAATRGTPQHRVVRISWGGALTLVGTVVALILARRIFVAAHRPLSWAVAAVVVAVLIDPVVDRLARSIRRGPAVALTFLAIGAAAVGLTYLVFDEVQEALDRLETAAPEAAATVEDRDDRLGEIARDANLVERVDDFVVVLQERVTGGDEVLRTTAGTAPTYLVGAILTIFVMTYGPRIAQGAVAQDPDESRGRRVSLLASAAVARARRATLLTGTVGMMLGLAATAAGFALDLPAPSALGAAVAVSALLPHVGIVAGSLPLLLLTLGFRSGALAIVLAGVVVVLQVLDSAIVRPRIARRSVDVGLLVPWMVGLLGYEVYGVGGAAYGVILSFFVLALLDRLEAANRAEAASAPPTGGEPAASPA